MLHDVVTRALSRLQTHSTASLSVPQRFRYAYASEDGHYVAIVSHDLTTYVVDLKQDRFCKESAGTPCGFTGHVLEMEADGGVVRQAACVEQFDLDLDQDELDWRHCARVS